MSAYICLKPKGYCKKCNHYRYDEDYGDFTCYAKEDNTPDINHITKTIMEGNNYGINK